MASHAARRSAGKLGHRDERRDTLVKCDPWHTTDYNPPIIFARAHWKSGISQYTPDLISVVRLFRAVRTLKRKM